MTHSSAIHVRGLGKQYHIGGPQKQYSRLGERLLDAARGPFRRAGKILRGQAGGAAELDQTIWALRDVSFDIAPGQVTGIIGRNGAGKSTLLKLLSQITEPSEGYADIYGRVGSLLEVGTGFHPELTGRENVYLNGAILGLRRHEIRRKFDEIVAFAEIEPFIDTPVKHYSSGMYVRLAFSVAAHLEAEILLVDEVLAVGDVAFQKKCLGKMDDVAQEGRTVLFVSHNMGLIQTLCSRGIYLEDGRVRVDADVNEAIAVYLRALENVSAQNLAARTDRSGRGDVRLVGVDICDDPGGPPGVLKAGSHARFVFHLNRMLPGISCLFVIFDHLGQQLAVFESREPGADDRRDPSLQATFVCDLPHLLLLPGRYRINVLIRDSGEQQDLVDAAAFFDVEGGQLNGRALKSRRRVSLYHPHQWTLPEGA